MTDTNSIRLSSRSKASDRQQQTGSEHAGDQLSESRRLPLINENEVQGLESSVLVQSPLKLTPIVGSPTPSLYSEGSGEESYISSARNES